MNQTLKSNISIEIIKTPLISQQTAALFIRNRYAEINSLQLFNLFPFQCSKYRLLDRFISTCSIESENLY